MGELTIDALGHEIAAFEYYREKGGGLDLESWMRMKDFHPEDREKIRKGVQLGQRRWVV